MKYVYLIVIIAYTCTFEVHSQEIFTSEIDKSPINFYHDLLDLCGDSIIVTEIILENSKNLQNDTIQNDLVGVYCIGNALIKTVYDLKNERKVTSIDTLFYHSTLESNTFTEILTCTNTNYIYGTTSGIIESKIISANYTSDLSGINEKYEYTFDNNWKKIIEIKNETLRLKTILIREFNEELELFEKRLITYKTM